MKKIVFILATIFCTLASQAQQQQTKEIKLLTGEKWWASGEYPTMLDDSKQCANNQFTLLVSSAGRYIWSTKPFSAYCNNEKLITTADRSPELVSAGKTLKEAYVTAYYKHLSKNVKAVDKGVFERPIYVMNISDQDEFTQDAVVRRAEWLIKEGFPKGVIILDDRWQQSYGTFRFDSERFPAPETMIAKLKSLGFDIILTVVPFVSPDSRIIRQQANNGNIIVGEDGQHAIIKWNRGYSCSYDLNNQSVTEMIAKTLENLRTKYNISGFKFENIEKLLPAQAAAWNCLAAKSKGNISNRMSAGTLFEIGYDDSTIEGVRNFVRRLLAFGLSGNVECVVSFETETTKENILNRIQFQSLMPIMKFSVEELEKLPAAERKKALEIIAQHRENVAYIETLLASRAAKGDPIIRPLEYEYPRKGFSDCDDQFMIGDKIIIALLSADNRSRTLRLPRGSWFDANGKKIKGPIVKTINYDNYPFPLFKLK